ncbi:hypothetical protein C1646_663952 [Rhizophagus diaphanus]|nr:hypothetical protein C1646_663952 [Rhizophagus diaphanus] [Rhizophagus sp. MUCL 43196]
MCQPRFFVVYPYYNDLELCDDLESNNTTLKSTNDLTLALKFCQDQDAVMLAYLLEYYSGNSMTHIGWMINVTKILPELSELSNHDYYEGATPSKKCIKMRLKKYDLYTYTRLTPVMEAYHDLHVRFQGCQRSVLFGFGFKTAVFS